MQLFPIISRLIQCAHFSVQKILFERFDSKVFLKNKNNFRIRSLPRKNINAKCDRDRL